MKIILALAVLLTASSAFSQTIILQPDEVTGAFTARVNTNTDDFRLERVCLYRTDVNSADPAAEFACSLVSTGRAPEPDEVVPSGEGVVVDITFTTALIPGQNQEFVVRNIAFDIGGEIASEAGPNGGIIPARPFSPVFIIISLPTP
jgi:hypothetical protein